MPDPTKPVSEIEKLQEKCRFLKSQNETLLNSEAEMKNTIGALERDIKALKKQQKESDAKLIRCGAYGAIADASSSQSESELIELRIKLTGAHEDHKEAQKDAQRYKTLYEESQQILSNYQSQSILKKTEDAKGITSKIDQILEKQIFSNRGGSNKHSTQLGFSYR